MKPIPVLLLVRELGLGGTERQLTEVARALDRKRFAPHVGYFFPGMRRDQLERAGVSLVRFPIHSFMSWSAIAGARQFVRYIRENNIRIVHSFDFPLNVFSAPIGRLFTKALVITSQRGHRDLVPGLYKTLLRRTDRFAHGIVVNCQFLKVHLIEDYGIAEGRIHVCHNGIDLDVFRPEGTRKRPSGATDGTPVIGSVSVLRPEKDFSTLIGACARLRGQRPFRVVLIGSGPELESLKRQASSSGLQDHIHFEPATEDVAPWLRGIDIFVLPSRSEALSNALMEAMACGCGAVTSNIGGNPELVTPDRTGLLFKAGDEASLAQALDFLLDGPERLARLRRAAADFVREEFSLTRSADRMGEIYLDLLERKHV